MLDKIKQLMEAKKQAETIKRELDQTLIECKAVDGIVLTLNGSQEFKSIVVDEQLLKTSSPKDIEDKLLRGVNAAIRQAQALATKKMQQMAGFNIPGV